MSFFAIFDELNLSGLCFDDFEQATKHWSKDMAGLGYTFDANDVEPSAPIEVLPPGKYEAQIVKSEIRESKKNTDNTYLWLEFSILSGDHTNKKVWTNLNLWNSNTTAAEIANKDMSAICRAIGRMQIQDTEELHFLPMMIDVKIKPAGEFFASNVIGGYSAVGSAPATTSRAAAPAARPAATAPASTAKASTAPAAAPWKRATA